MVIVTEMSFSWLSLRFYCPLCSYPVQAGSLKTGVWEVSGHVQPAPTPAVWPEIRQGSSAISTWWDEVRQRLWSLISVLDQPGFLFLPLTSSMLFFNTDHQSAELGMVFDPDSAVCLPSQKFRELCLVFCPCHPWLVCQRKFELLFEVFHVTGVFVPCLSLPFPSCWVRIKFTV